MKPMDGTLTQQATTTIRASDVERNSVCDLLATHYAAGRLSGPDLEQRIDRAMGAQTRGDLDQLLTDLPATVPAAPSPPLPRSEAATGWRGREVWVLTVLICSLMITGVMLLGSLAFSPGVFVFSLFGGTIAAVGGACLFHLVRTPRR